MVKGKAEAQQRAVPQMSAMSRSNVTSANCFLIAN